MRVTILILLVAACADPATVQDDFEARLSSSHVWSGGTLAIVSADFGHEDLPRVEIADDTLAGVLVNDTTMQADVPVLNAGEYPVRLVGPGFGRIIGEVVVHGLVDVRPSPRIDWYPMLWPPTSLNPTILTNQGGHLAFIDLRTGTSVAFPDTVHNVTCANGPGPTHQADRILLARRAQRPGFNVCVFDAWSLSPALQLTRSDTVVGYGTLAAQVSPAVIMGMSAHELWTTGGTGTFNGRYEDTRGIRLCPAGNIATILMGYSDPGLPFFDGTSGLLRFSVPTIKTGRGAAFTAGCDTVYVVGQESPSTTPSIMGLMTADGKQFALETLAKVPLDLVLDPTGRWLFVAAPNVVLVIDRATLKTVGKLSVPPRFEAIPILALSGAYQQLYASDGYQIFRFDIAMP